MDLKKMRFDNEYCKKIKKIMNPLLHEQFKNFFELGIEEIKKDIIPFIETYDLNRKNMTDEDFRHFSNSIIDCIKDKLKG